MWILIFALKGRIHYDLNHWNEFESKLIVAAMQVDLMQPFGLIVCSTVSLCLYFEMWNELQVLFKAKKKKWNEKRAFNFWIVFIVVSNVIQLMSIFWPHFSTQSSTMEKKQTAAFPKKRYTRTFSVVIATFNFATKWSISIVSFNSIIVWTCSVFVCSSKKPQMFGKHAKSFDLVPISFRNNKFKGRKSKKKRKKNPETQSAVKSIHYRWA